MEIFHDSFELLNRRLSSIFASWIELIPNLLFAGVFFFIAYKLCRKMRSYILASFPLNNRNQLANRIISDVSYAIALMIVFSTTLSILNLDKAVYSLLTGAGVFGIVVGFAFQDLSSNLIGGIIIAFQSPFELGHWIKIGQTEGMVSKIGLRVTELILATKEQVYIPNKDFLAESLTNYTKAGERKISLKINVSPQFDFNSFSNAAKAALSDLYGRKNNTEIEVFNTGFVSLVNPSYLGDQIEITIDFVIDFPGNNNYMIARSQAVEKIAKLLV